MFRTVGVRRSTAPLLDGNVMCSASNPRPGSSAADRISADALNRDVLKRLDATAANHAARILAYSAST